MMMHIQKGHEVFVHASDIQLLADEPIEQIMKWSPTMPIASGLAMYRNLSADELAQARARALEMDGFRCRPNGMTDACVGQRRRKHFGMKPHNPRRGALPQGTRDMCKWYPVCPMKVLYECGVLRGIPEFLLDQS